MDVCPRSDLLSQANKNILQTQKSIMTVGTDLIRTGYWGHYTLQLWNSCPLPFLCSPGNLLMMQVLVQLLGDHVQVRLMQTSSPPLEIMKPILWITHQSASRVSLIQHPWIWKSGRIFRSHFQYAREAAPGTGLKSRGLWEMVEHTVKEWVPSPEQPLTSCSADLGQVVDILAPPFPHYRCEIIIARIPENCADEINSFESSA